MLPWQQRRQEAPSHSDNQSPLLRRYVGQDDPPNPRRPPEKPLIHRTSMKRHSEPGHVENRCHGYIQWSSVRESVAQRKSSLVKRSHISVGLSGWLHREEMHEGRK
ncbi:unnamed protein product [Pleuronectes platessa]|uniref:Uncharacterized protein n=1 Tax=Pleuronectes platessa TaxID=8262 RepID=A0A9N7W484_PLEPL|nr:unnamed protein product [Pleuronectes platessa]